MNSKAKPESATPAPLANRQRLFILLRAGLLAIVLAVAGFWLLIRDSTSSTNGSINGQQFKNWLQPASQIKIGNHRYYSACQLLPKSAAESAFGKLTDITVVQETYLDQSVSQARQPLQLGCNYNHVTGSGQDVSLRTEQYVDQAQAQDIRYSLGSFKDEQVQQELDLYAKAVTATKNKPARDFLDTLNSSFATYKQYNAELDSAKRQAIKTNFMLLPVSESLSGALDDFAFVGLYNNVTFTLGHTPASAKGRNDLAKHSDQELVRELLAIQKATAAITKNLQNKSLGQSPAPTTLGTTDKYGSTTILEPCAIMSPALFTQITGGKRSNTPVDRTSASLNFVTKRYTKQDHKLILPSNSCTRQSTNPLDDFNNSNTYATFSLEYGSSAKQAETWLADSYKAGSGDVALQTAADWATMFANPLQPGGPPVVVFRVGPYVGHIGMYTAVSGQDNVEATQDQYVQAINALAPAIRQAATDAR